MTKRIFITGIVQGVGFRPCCKKVADSMQLSGTVKNLGANAEIVIRCEDRVTESFLRRLVSLLPETARIDSVTVIDTKEFTGNGFSIIESSPSENILPEIIPDTATCAKCISELKDKKDRRFRHPFISCTACGPRYSIITRLPYDRENTLMDSFGLCPKCAEEYTDPKGRRLHAQTVACNSCGPVLSFLPKSDGEPIRDAIKSIKKGGVVAVKDIGGFHFVCLPNSKEAVQKLRFLKLRQQKPFAVMFPDLASAKEYANITKKEEGLLISPSAPIVLCEKTKEFLGDVCGISRYVGVMLPSNPVQHLLTEELGPLIMTSGNISGEPIITDNLTMTHILKNSEYLDGVLLHNREIITPLDDSIYYVINERAHLLRRGRGVAPESIPLSGSDPAIFASGGDLKACFGFYKNGRAVLSQHFGDLEDQGCCEKYEEAIHHIKELFAIEPELLVCDLHPAYFSKNISKGVFKNIPALEVQHHHAHIASVMAEHSLEEVLGISLDGTGYGTDGTVWGGEALLCKCANFERIAHLKSVSMCGGDEISKNAAQALACYLYAAGIDIPENFISAEEADIIKAALDMNINTLSSSSCGRLFDAVCCLLSFGSYNDYEGKCAIALENAANTALKEGILAHPLKLYYNDGELDTVSLVSDILKAKNDGADPFSLALGFHYALAEGFIEVAKTLGIKSIALSGGCFNNRILTAYLYDRLTAEGFAVYLNEKVPCGDGGVALGQLYIAERKNHVCCITG